MKNKESRCPKCDAGLDAKEFSISKCRRCGGITKSSFKRPKGGWKLFVSQSQGHPEIIIRGDKAGLQFLAQCCLSVIGRKDASNHILIEPLMYNASRGSVPITICFDEDGENKLEPAATGRAAK